MGGLLLLGDFFRSFFFSSLFSYCLKLGCKNMERVPFYWENISMSGHPMLLLGTTIQCQFIILVCLFVFFYLFFFLIAFLSAKSSGDEVNLREGVKKSLEINKKTRSLVTQSLSSGFLFFFFFFAIYLFTQCLFFFGTFSQRKGSYRKFEKVFGFC